MNDDLPVVLLKSAGPKLDPVRAGTSNLKASVDNFWNCVSENLKLISGGGLWTFVWDSTWKGFVSVSTGTVAGSIALVSFGTEETISKDVPNVVTFHLLWRKSVVGSELLLSSAASGNSTNVGRLNLRLTATGLLFSPRSVLLVTPAERCVFVMEVTPPKWRPTRLTYLKRKSASKSFVYDDETWWWSPASGINGQNLLRATAGTKAMIQWQSVSKSRKQSSTSWDCVLYRMRAILGVLSTNSSESRFSRSDQTRMEAWMVITGRQDLTEQCGHSIDSMRSGRPWQIASAQERVTPSGCVQPWFQQINILTDIRYAVC